MPKNELSPTKAALAEVDDSDAENRALLVGEKLQADYVLFGSLTVFGDSVSIDAKMADVSGQQPPLPFYAQTQGMGAVIPQINQFAANINGVESLSRPLTSAPAWTRSSAIRSRPRCTADAKAQPSSATRSGSAPESSRIWTISSA